jgi:D-alanyl-D-alanine carboxypeptidase
MLIAKALLTTAVVLTTALSTPDAAARTEPAPTRTPLGHIASQLVRDGAPGALVLVRTPAGTRRAARGLGSRAPRVALRPADRFRVASVTKTFVATVVLQLVSEGKLGLDDPVDRRLPGLLPDGGAITVRELLSHTSGLFDYDEDEAWQGTVIAHPDREWSPRELVAVATSHGLLFPPGTAWFYSDTNYEVLGLLVEAVTGTTLEHQLRERIFEPLGLAATSLPTEAAIDGAHAHGYVGSGTLPWLPWGTLVDATTLVSPSIWWAASAIVANADDLARFYAALLGGRLIRADLLAAMRSASPVTRGTLFEYGLGLEQFRTACGRAFGHLGDGLGYRTAVYARADGRRVAVAMINVDSTRVSWWDLESSVGDALCRG